MPGLVEQKPGHSEIIGETAAKLLLFQQGWNPYTRFLDVDKVDIVLRRNKQGRVDYREIQVKYRRLFASKATGWAGKFFKDNIWYAADAGEFTNHRDGFFIMFIFAKEDRSIDNDVLIFPSKRLHEIIQQAPFQKKGSETKRVYISRSHDGRWFIRLTGIKFAAIDDTTCIDVTEFNRNYKILE